MDARSPGHIIAVRGVSDQANKFLAALIHPTSSRRLSVTEVLEHKWINPTDRDMIIAALIGGNIPLANLHIKSGTRCPSRISELRIAAAYGHIDLVKRALQRSGHVIEDDKCEVIVGLDTEPALVAAASGGHVEIVKPPLGKPQYCVSQHVYRRAAEQALEHRHTAVIDEIWPRLTAVCAVGLNSKIAAFATPRFLEVVVRNLETAMFVPDGATAQVRAWDHNFEAMVTAAAREGRIDNFDILIRFRSYREILDTALMAAAGAGKHDLVEHILDHHPPAIQDICFPRRDITPPDLLSNALTNAAHSGNLAAVRSLVAFGAFPSPAAASAAVAGDHTFTFRFLVHVLRGISRPRTATLLEYFTSAAIPHCDVTILNCHPDTAALCVGLKTYVGAARLGYADVVQWLLTNVHASGRQYSAAVEEGLVGASERGHVEVVRVLCGMTVSGDLGRAVEMAAGAGNVDVLEILLDRRAPGLDLKGALSAAMASNQLGTMWRLQMVIRGGLYWEG